MKKSKKKSIFTFGALGASVLAVALMIFAISKTVSDISDATISKTPTAILASSGIAEGTSLSVPVSYFDQRADECVDLYDIELDSAVKQRQFEWTKCGYESKEVEQGLVDFALSKTYLPVAVPGELTPNRGLDFGRWFSVAEGQSQAYAGALEMKYESDGAVFSFYNSEFYPLDEADFSDGDFVNEDGHNHLFTMAFAVPFSPLLSGDEEMTIEADDDTFVFVKDKLVLDMGGIHDATVGRIKINKEGEVYASSNGEELTYSGVRISGKEGAIIRIFHADRDSKDSVLNLVFKGMKLNVTESRLASGDTLDGGIQVAYDPSDPSYVAPLGESQVFHPDITNGLLIVATIEGFAIIALTIMMMVVIRYLVRRK